MEITRLAEHNKSGRITVYDMPAAPEKFTELKDAKQTGRLMILPGSPRRLVILPFSIGQTVYVLVCGRVLELTVLGYCFDEKNRMFLEDAYGYWGSRYIHEGNSVFGTREEAEAVLKGRTG